MNKLGKLLVLLILSYNYIYLESNNLTNFYKSLEIYRPHAPWVTQEFELLTVGEFNSAWQEIVTLLTQEDRRWFYFCDKKEAFNKDNFWFESLWQCKFYDTWLKNMCIDIVNLELITKEQAQILDIKSVTIFDYWQIAGKSEPEILVAQYNFYAFYIDCLSYFFYNLVQKAHDNMRDPAEFKAAIGVAQRCLEVICEVMVRLKNSHYFASYQLSLKRYNEVFDLLQAELINQIIRT